MTVSLCALILRLAVGGIFAAQGASRLWGIPKAPAGQNLARLLEKRGLPAPAALATVVSVFEFGAGLLLMCGALTRLAALPLIVIVGTAVWFKRKDGFIGGWDWPFSVLGGTVALLVLGAGAFSIDAIFQIPFIR